MQLEGDVVTAARSLLGAVLVGHGVSVRITEVEAYAGADDPASHAWRGPTARTTVMFGPAGVLYVYRSYGLHWCANVVTGPDGLASAVLLRAGVVVGGMPLARRRRGTKAVDDALARGPANLCSALGLTGDDDGVGLLGAEPPRLLTGTSSTEIESGPRVGVSRAPDVPWRFWTPGEGSVSAYRRSPRAPSA